MNRGRCMMVPDLQATKGRSGYGLVLLVAACLLLAACSQRARDGTAAAGPAAAAKDDTQDGIIDRTAIMQSWQAQDRLVQKHLDGYGWVNRAAGIVHIPIDRAMNLIVARNISSGPATDPARIHDYSETNTALQNTGRRLLRQYGCTVCHDPDAPIHAPSLIGIYGQRVRLSDGSFVRADEKYLHDSIMVPSKQVVAGYEPIMPTFGNIITEGNMREIIAYLKSTSAVPAPIPALAP